MRCTKTYTLKTAGAVDAQTLFLAELDIFKNELPPFWAKSLPLPAIRLLAPPPSPERVFPTPVYTNQSAERDMRRSDSMYNLYQKSLTSIWAREARRRLPGET